MATEQNGRPTDCAHEKQSEDKEHRKQRHKGQHESEQRRHYAMQAILMPTTTALLRVCSKMMWPPGM